MKSFIEQQHLPIKKTAKIHTKGGKRNSVAKADRYFSSLSEDQVRKLYEIYKYDFQMFGYEYESYLQLASLNTNKKKNEFDLALEKVREEEKYERKKENKTQKFKQKKSNNRKGQVGGGGVEGVDLVGGKGVTSWCIVWPVRQGLLPGGR